MLFLWYTKEQGVLLQNMTMKINTLTDNKDVIACQGFISTYFVFAYLDNRSWYTKQQSVLRQNMTKKINTIRTLIGYLSTAVFTKHLIG